MSLNKNAKKKISKIGPTNLPGFYQFDNKEKAIIVINLFEEYINNDGTFQKSRNDACCDPIYQELSAALDYYKFDIKREKYKSSKYH
jgi:hypothetical protein